MKHLILTILIAVACNAASAQSAKMVKWTFTSKKIADKTYEVHFAAIISKGYHLYSQSPGSDGPLPTRFLFNNNPLAVVNGKTRELGKLISIYDDAWKGKVRYFEKTVTFVQVVKIKSPTTITGKIEFMVSSHTETHPPTELQFAIKVGE